MRLDVVRDVLDKQLLDVHRRRVGKVDGLVLELPRGGPPRVAALRLGSGVWARRLGPWVERAVAWLSRRFWREQPGVWEIPWSAVLHLGENVQIDREAGEVGSLAWERWLGRRVVGPIPGSDR